jgi:N-acetylglucosaminyl-diphospho-decaprenol L-rhamnosyltransferase
MTGAARVAAVVVNYNTRELLVACLRSLLAARGRGELAEIVVVDSASSDGSDRVAQRLLSTEHALCVPNRGYGAAANAGIAATSAEYVLILNADTVVTPGAVEELAAALDRRPGVAVAGPCLLYPDGTVQPTLRRFPTRLTPVFESTIVQEWWPRNRWVRAYHMHDAPRDTPRDVDWLVGAALLVRRAALERVGGFDPAFRMFSEEVEWCWRFRRHGWSVRYIPTAKIMHHEGASTAQDVPRRQQDFDASRVLLLERMYGARHARFVATLLRAGYGLYLMREAAKWMFGHRRELRLQRMRFYVAVLRAGIDWQPGKESFER